MLKTLTLAILFVPGVLYAQAKNAAPNFLWEIKGSLLSQVAVSPDGKTVAYSRNEISPMEFKSGVVLVGAKDGKELHALVAKPAEKNPAKNPAPQPGIQAFGPLELVSALAFSADSKQLATIGATFGAGSAHLRIWDVASGKLTKQIPVSVVHGQTVAFLPEGKQVLVGGVGQQSIYLKILDIAKGTGTDLAPDFRTRLAKHASSQGMLTACCLAADGRTALLGVGDFARSALHIFDLKTKNVEANVVPLGAMRPFANVAVSPDGQTVALARQSMLPGGFGTGNFPGPFGPGGVPPKVGPGGVEQKIGPGGVQPQVAPGANFPGVELKSAVEIWDRASKKKLHQFDLPVAENAFATTGAVPMQFTPDSRVLLSAAKSKGHVGVYDVQSGKTLAEHDTGLPTLSRLALAGNLLVTSADQMGPIFGGGGFFPGPGGPKPPPPPGGQPPPPPPPDGQPPMPPQGGPVFGGFGMPNLQATIKVWEWTAPTGSTRPAPSQSRDK